MAIVRVQILCQVPSPQITLSVNDEHYLSIIHISNHKPCPANAYTSLTGKHSHNEGHLKCRCHFGSFLTIAVLDAYKNRNDKLEFFRHIIS